MLTQTAGLLAEPVLFFLPLALALARGVNLAREVRLVLRQEFALMPAGLHLRYKRVLLLA